jgi:hypothetical protein
VINDPSGCPKNVSCFGHDKLGAIIELTKAPTENPDRENTKLLQTSDAE